MSEETPLMAHLIELRGRVMRSVAVWAVATCICYVFSAEIYQFFLQPLADAFGNDSSHRLISTNLTETFVTYLKLAIYGGFFVAFPYIASEIYLFVAPGLFKHERMVVAPYLIVAPILFFMGAAMAYYFVMPKAWEFFLSFEVPKGEGAVPLMLEAKVSEYLGLVMHIVLAFGLAFQLPIVLTLLIRFGMVSTKVLAKGRRYAVVILLTIAAFITPPDILSQVLLFIPLYALYEISIVVGRMIERRRPAPEHEITHA
ncbi:MAG: twin-arginine translocase subunit TatC [Pseudomonadota bacterium]